MKKIILSLAIAMSAFSLYAQTNTFPSSGNVGIGTGSPRTLLDVNGSFYLNRPSAMVDAGNTLGTTSYIKIAPTTMSSSNAGYANLGFPDNNTVGIYTDYDGHVGNSGTLFRDIQFGRIGLPYLTIKDGGNVGIGTTTPDQKLTVNGTIHSTEVKVTPTIPVPDYVFEKTYQLINLTELKSYLAANHHLPEIPSAVEIEKNGLNLSDMNLKLLKKVEELTLYIINEDKQLSDQQKEIDELKTQLKAIIQLIPKH